jgi:hypothetical protein
MASPIQKDWVFLKNNLKYKFENAKQGQRCGFVRASLLRLIVLAVVLTVASNMRIFNPPLFEQINLSYQDRSNGFAISNGGTRFAEDMTSSIRQVVHTPPSDGLRSTDNFYEILHNQNDGCPPLSSRCAKCLRKQRHGVPTCSKCKKSCACYCGKICNTAVPSKFVSKTIYVQPPKHDEKTGRLIPRIVHQTFFESVMPDKYPNFARFAQSFNHSGWEYRFYTDDDIVRFLERHFPPEILEAYYALKHGAFRADLFRYCVLLIHGGVYADVDVLLHANLDVVIEPDVGFMVPNDEPGIASGQQMCLWNGFMAAAPGHPFLAKAIELAVNQIRNRFTIVDIANSFCPYSQFDGLYRWGFLFLTGPCLLGRSVNKVLGLADYHGFVPGTTLEAQSGIPGRTVILKQVKNDLSGFHTAAKGDSGLIVFSTDHPDDREDQDDMPEHYSRSQHRTVIFGASWTYVDHQMMDEEIHIEVEHTNPTTTGQHAIAQWREPQFSNTKRTRKDRLVWLMSFPNSGTSYTLHMVKQASNRTPASNYGAEFTTESQYESLSIYGEESEEGPFRPLPGGTMGFPPELPQAMILTKTHCDTYDAIHRPASYIPTAEKFLRGCRRTFQLQRHDGTERSTILESWYSLSRIAKAIHLIRNPFDNVVSRYHNELVVAKWTRDYEQSQKDFPNDSKGFHKWCDLLGNGFAEEDKEYFRQDVLNVTCYTEFYKWVQWHNLAVEVLHQMMPVQIPLLTIYYEDYAKNLTATSQKILDFLELEFVGEIVSFKQKNYDGYWSDDEMKDVSRFVQRFASKPTWNLVKHYFEFAVEFVK